MNEQGKTVIMVTHEPDIAAYTKRIIVMRDGKIVEKGKHEELLGMNGFYADIYNAQFVRG